MFQFLWVLIDCVAGTVPESRVAVSRETSVETPVHLCTCAPVLCVDAGIGSLTQLMRKIFFRQIARFSCDYFEKSLFLCQLYVLVQYIIIQYTTVQHSSCLPFCLF